MKLWRIRPPEERICPRCKELVDFPSMRLVQIYRHPKDSARDRYKALYECPRGLCSRGEEPLFEIEIT